MTPQLTVKLTPQAQETLRVVQTLPQNILAGIAAQMDLQNQYTVSHIVRDYLSFPKDGPSTDIGLRVQTGRGRGSIRASKPVVQGQEVKSAIGSDVGYMGTHEFGATIPAHDIVAKGGALRFKIGDRVLFRKKVHIPEVELPARAPVQHGIEDRLDDYGAAFSAEIQKLWDGGKA
jgi:hypothetical protein